MTETGTSPSEKKRMPEELKHIYSYAEDIWREFRSKYVTLNDLCSDHRIGHMGETIDYSAVITNFETLRIIGIASNCTLYALVTCDSGSEMLMTFSVSDHLNENEIGYVIMRGNLYFALYNTYIVNYLKRYEQDIIVLIANDTATFGKILYKFDNSRVSHPAGIHTCEFFMDDVDIGHSINYSGYDPVKRWDLGYSCGKMRILKSFKIGYQSNFHSIGRSHNISVRDNEPYFVESVFEFIISMIVLFSDSSSKIENPKLNFVWNDTSFYERIDSLSKDDVDICVAFEFIEMIRKMSNKHEQPNVSHNMKSVGKKIYEFYLSKELEVINHTLETLSENSEEYDEPLPILLLRAVVYEHSLMLRRRLIQT